MTQAVLQGVTPPGGIITHEVPYYPTGGTALHQPPSSRRSPCQPSHAQSSRWTCTSWAPGRYVSLPLFRCHTDQLHQTRLCCTQYHVALKKRSDDSLAPIRLYLYWVLFLRDLGHRFSYQQVSKQAEEHSCLHFPKYLNLGLACISTLRPKLSPAFLLEEVLCLRGPSGTILLLPIVSLANTKNIWKYSLCVWLWEHENKHGNTECNITLCYVSLKPLKEPKGCCNLWQLPLPSGEQ